MATQNCTQNVPLYLRLAHFKHHPHLSGSIDHKLFLPQTAQPTCSKVYNAGVGGGELQRVLGERVDSGSLI